MQEVNSQCCDLCIRPVNTVGILRADISCLQPHPPCSAAIGLADSLHADKCFSILACITQGTTQDSHCASKRSHAGVHPCNPVSQKTPAQGFVVGLWHVGRHRRIKVKLSSGAAESTEVADPCGLLRRDGLGCLQLRVACEAAPEALCAAGQQRRALRLLLFHLERRRDTLRAEYRLALQCSPISINTVGN